MLDSLRWHYVELKYKDIEEWVGRWMMDGYLGSYSQEPANSLVREKKDINTDKQVQSQTQAVPTAGAPGVM